MYASLFLIFHRQILVISIDNSLLSDSVLGCVFQPRYMTLALCAHLENVSKLFMKKTDEFYQQVEHVDMHHCLASADDVNWTRKIFRRCPNLKSVGNVRVNKASLDRDVIGAQLVGKLKSITSVGVNFDVLSPLALLAFIDVSSVQLCTRGVSVDDEPSLKLKPMENLRVMSLRCDRLLLLDFCQPHLLEALHLTDSQDGVEKLMEKLRVFQHLSQLTIEQGGVEKAPNLLKLANFVADELGVEVFRLKLLYFLDDGTLVELAAQEKLRKCLVNLRLFNISWENTPRLLPMFNLSTLFLLNVSGPTDVFLESMPSLNFLFQS